MSRPAVPADLQRQLLIETGYRCAVCKTPEPLEIEHIEEWAEVKNHKFENMIVLCANCHSRKSNKANPRKIDKISLKKIKNELLMINSRYSDLEKRFLEHCSETIPIKSDSNPQIRINSSLTILVKRIIDDGYATLGKPKGLVVTSGVQDKPLMLVLTEEGRNFVSSLTIFSDITTRSAK